MISSTLPRFQMITTQCGMNSILKKYLSPVDYIRHSVQSGTYRDPYHKPERRRNFRNKEKAIEEYPKQFEILTLNPPLPPQPRVTKKDENLILKYENKKDKKDPMKQYVKDYLQRYDYHQRQSCYKPSNHYTSLGIPNISKMEQWDTSLKRKTVALNRAYDYAIRKVYTNIEKEGKSVSMVDDFLHEEERKERHKVRRNSRNVKKWRNNKSQKQNGILETKYSENFTKDASKHNNKKDNKKEENSNDESFNIGKTTKTLPSIFHNKPRTVQAMHLWGQRLASVPYTQWTVGAATALDHWIAVDVLGMSEETWNRLLDGELESDVELAEKVALGETEHGNENPLCVGNSSRGRDIVQVRNHLFPETIMSVAQTNEEEEKEQYGKENTEIVSKDDRNVKKQTVEQILQRLSLDPFSENENNSESIKKISTSKLLTQDLGCELSSLLDRLQQFRTRHLESSYKNWENKEKEEFDKWLKKYLALITTPSDKHSLMDLEEIRNSLLSQSPLSREQSRKFWSQIQDETDAELFLQELHRHWKFVSNNKKFKNKIKQKNQEGNILSVRELEAQKAYKDFRALPYRQQLSQLVNLGTLRPIYDEYTEESDRHTFFSNYGDLLLEGIEMLHLISDPDGPIHRSEIGRGWIPKRGFSDEQFNIVKLPWGQDEYNTERAERARAMYRAWNLHKAGRARYEEELFKLGKLTLNDDRVGKRKKMTRLEPIFKKDEF